MPRYIDADKLKEKAEKAHFYDEAGFDAPERAVRESDIDSIPTADVRENEHGRWIMLEPLIGLLECNVCGWRILRKETDFCPRCGAKMNEEESQCGSM